ILKIPFVITKCGGENPSGYFPHTRYLVLFSKENLMYFRNNKKFKNCSLFYIPNRVSVITQDNKRINELKSKLNITQPVILRISRISEQHSNSIYQSIALVKKLNLEGISCCLVIIGTVTDELLAEKIQSLTSNCNYIHIVSCNEYTKSANQLIDIGDIVVGTGRGFMEAAVLKKRLLAPTKNTELPIVITNNNIKHFHDRNFSSRVDCHINENENYTRIKDLICGKLTEKHFSNYDEYAENNFLLSKSIDKYNNLYSISKYDRVSDWLMPILGIMKLSLINVKQFLKNES
ncbi:MAG: hypothetical protein ACOCQ4_02910, partial [bacterium]